ncbi:GGDEF domain-containing protein [Azonexus hydrophilus]|uniref:GGDEF domain-containing protein n=1 Tax=Azonexus hydrophilus TaxID=418702 RepID=UPI002493608C|nr:GGDEF domain-containing protein [Azonexus hydrophilus]
MSDQRNPSVIAREALKRLASRHLAPTPANFQACYNEIANLPNVSPFPEPPLRQLAAALTPRGDAQIAQLSRLDSAISGRSWQGVQDALQGFIAAGAANASATHLPHETTQALLHLFETMLPAFGRDDVRFAEAVDALLAALRISPCEFSRLDTVLREFAVLVPCAVEEQIEIRESLLKLLQLIIQNIGELSVDDTWFKGQIDGLLAAVEPPLTLRHLDEMERRLRDVMEKQSRARARSVEAQEEMRQMLAAFIERLGTMNSSSAQFQERIENSARQIEQISRIEDLAPLLRDVVSATQAMAEETAVSREQLRGLQDKVLATEAELIQLHRELDSASSLARHDPLTDTLNRKGLDEALEREIAAMRRRNSALSLSLLDIDNFKRLNDRLGHEAGDNALIHLAKVARACMRPTDTLARYGGEEFIILMPDTSLEQGIEAMVRLQRELTKAFFLSGKDKVLITFSAGVAQLDEGESGSDAIRRADLAMYQAKRAGKNRVIGA